MARRALLVLGLLVIATVPAAAHNGEDPPGVPFYTGQGPGATFPGSSGFRVPTRPAGNDPATSGAVPGVEADHWRVFWYLNRDRWIDRTARLREAAPATPDDQPAPSVPADRRDALRASAIEALRTASADGNADLASTALVALGKAGDAASRDRFLQIAVDRSIHRDIRQAAILAAGLAGAPDGDARDRLATLMEDKRGEVTDRALAGLALGYLGDPGAVLPLVAQSRQKEAKPDVPALAAIGLGLLGDEIVLPDLGRWLSGPIGLREPDDLVRASLATALGKLGSADAVPSLVKALADRDRNVRRQAVLSLGGLVAATDAETVRVLVRVLATEADSVTGSWAALALGESGAAVAADPVLEIYEGADQARVPYAAIALGLLAGRQPAGPLRDRIRGFLARELVKSGNQDRTMALACACGLGGVEAAKPKLLALFRSDAPSPVRSASAVALGMLGAKEALPHLRAALAEKGDPWLIWDVALALGLMGDRDSPPLLAKQVREGSSQFIRAASAMAMGYVARIEEAEALIELVGNRDEPAAVRTSAAAGLGLLLDERRIPILTRVHAGTSPLLPIETLILALSIR